MSFLAANPASYPDLSPCLIERAIASLSTGNGGGDLRPYLRRTCLLVSDYDCGELPQPMCRRRLCSGASLPLCIPFLLSHRFGGFPAPGGTRSSASHSHPSKRTPRLPGTPISAPFRGLGSSQKKLANHGTKRRANFFRAPPRKQTFGAWEPGPLARLRPV
jgi:hypothetical protein